MSKRDVINYYIQCQEDYLTMKKNLEEVKKAVESRFLEEDRFLQAKKEVEAIKDNYERIAFILMLLNKPPKSKKKKRKKEEVYNEYVYDYLANSSLDKIKQENYSALEKLKEIAKNNDN